MLPPTRPVGFLGAAACGLLYGAVWGLGTYSLYQIVQRISATMPGSSKKKKISKPEKWIRVGRISKLIIYPIKSCQGTEVNQAKLTSLGLQGIGSPQFLRDRIFLIINDKGTFQTQRNYPRLALLQVEINDDSKLVLSAPEKETITVDLASLGPTKHQKVRIWNDQINGKELRDLGDAVGLWLDNFLNETGFRIVYHASSVSQRGQLSTLHKKFSLPEYESCDLGTFQDDTSYMLMATESIEALNTKLEARNAPPSSHKNFRPSILVEGIPDPFSEDDWAFIRVGNKNDGPVLKATMPCARCRLTTVDPETGIFNEAEEPRKTILEELRRKVGDSKTTELIKTQAILGIHFGLFEGDDSIVSIGDPIYAALL